MIISISLSLEGLVYVFRAGEIDISLLPYPAVLILTSILTMVALGHYQKNSVVTENDLLIDSYAKTDRLLAKKLLFKRETEDDLAIEEARIRRIALEVADDLKVEEARDRRIIGEKLPTSRRESSCVSILCMKDCSSLISNIPAAPFRL